MHSKAEFESVVASCVVQAEKMFSCVSGLDWFEYGPSYGTALKYSDFPSLPHLCDLLSSVVSIIRTAENAGAAIHRLPTEILAKIFAYLPQEATSSHTFYRTDFPDVESQSVHDYVIPSQVCRHWRQILLSSPSYWTPVILHDDNMTANDKFVDLYLTRSVPHPVDVWTATSSGLGIIAEHSSRLRSLQIQLDESWTPLVQDAFRALSGSAPLLESLNCRIASPDGLEQIEGPESQLPKLFAGDIPALRKLRMSGFTSWNENQFKHLTHLCVQGWPCDWAIPDGFQDLLSLIRDCPTVEELYLSLLDPWIPASEWDEPLLDAVELTRLRRLSLGDSTVSQCMCLLSHLLIPPNASLSVHRASLSGESSDEIVLGFLTDAFRLQNLTDIHTLITRASCAALAFGPSGSMRISTFYNWPIKFLNFSDIARLPFASTLREVWLQSPEQPQPDWFAFFFALPSLRKLTLENVVTKFMLQALSRQSSPPQFPTRQVLCPSLETLWIIADGEMSSNVRTSSYYDLLHCVEMRHASQVPLRELRMTAPWDGVEWPRSMVEALEAYVGSLDMDAKDLKVDIPSELNEDMHLGHWPAWE
ncbi:hypothetical protein EIP91_004419 [Steccherinum ochraceum]|uniref:F-box domain-containing protein n=1 Tax=Steccherinum ochraceum TaxID=92696 RepID=A0A4R0RZZ3_9APHY|nr:hypothetical protein EIP91_004419 [Steccherinum ochraceum]